MSRCVLVMDAVFYKYPQSVFGGFSRETGTYARDGRNSVLSLGEADVEHDGGDTSSNPGYKWVTAS